MEAKFNIDINIYPSNIIQEAILDFNEISKIILEEKNLIIYGENKKDIEEVFNEFMNYIIGLMN